MNVNERKVDFRQLFQYRIRHLRETAGYTRKEIANILEVFEDTYKKWEIGPEGTMPMAYVFKFCNVVRTNLEDLLNPRPVETEARAIIAHQAALEHHYVNGRAPFEETENPQNGKITY